jgi:2-polyprenyl-3-methyl-5-hydroxy-6-metoxy-1,4-benzoquinol methylase
MPTSCNKNKVIMFIKYKANFKSQDIDLKKLRPGKSYEYLIKNRNVSFGKFNSKIKKKFLKTRPCPSCNFFKTTKKLTKDNFDIVKCNKCNLIFVNPILDKEQYLKAYKSKEYQKIMKSLGEKSHMYRVNRFGKERVNYLSNFFKKKKIRALDVGCSTGFFLEAAKKKNWDCEGLELNPSAADFGKKRGLKIYEQDLSNFKTKKKYDIITLFDVLEHLADPKKIIEQAKKLLKNQGLLYVYVPNWNCASRILMKEKNCHFIWPTHHLTYFTPETLSYFFRRLKLKIIDWETQGLDLFDYNWFTEYKKGKSIMNNHELDVLQNYINSSGNGKNLRMLVKKI